MTLDEFVARAGSVQFKEHGRDWDGWDCFGLVYCFYREVRGVIVPDYLTAYENTLDKGPINAAVNDGIKRWTRVEKPVPGDGVLLSCARRPVHMGLIISARDFLHTEVKINTVVEDFTSLLWQRRVLGFYRYEGSSCV